MSQWTGQPATSEQPPSTHTHRYTDDTVDPALSPVRIGALIVLRFLLRTFSISGTEEKRARNISLSIREVLQYPVLQGHTLLGRTVTLRGVGESNLPLPGGGAGSRREVLPGRSQAA